MVEEDEIGTRLSVQGISSRTEKMAPRDYRVRKEDFIRCPSLTEIPHRFELRRCQ
jgi:hypothetical protein